MKRYSFDKPIRPENIPLGDSRTWHPTQRAPFVGYRGMVSFIKGLQDDNDDAMILLDGLEGSGKSTVGFQLARHLDPSWNPEDGLIIDFDDWENVYSLEERRVFLLDEGGDLLFSRDSQRVENKLVIRMFQMARIYNHVLIVLCPNIHWVDLYVRDHRALIWGHVLKEYHSRGVRRGRVTWNWPDRRFDWESSEFSIRWNDFATSKFKQVRHSRVWGEYEQLKKAKVASRQSDLMMQRALKSARKR